MRVRKRIRVKGIVQGVGFRWFTRKYANLLGIGGFVRNLPDGSVLVEAEGDPFAVEALIEKLKVGPSHAVVESLEIEDIAPKGEYVFRIEY
ncbi:acylphosphatase [bacterium 3DAC]|jgi:acylphosphatase|nr:acylphosphatase [Dictyoglomota bacterium]UZN23186.1 acylphosphatase [bacterium 3DAC]